MLNLKCKHREWQLVKVKGMRGFRIWQCKHCKLMLKEKTRGFHEVFIIRGLKQKPVAISLKVYPPKTPLKSRVLSSEINKLTQLPLSKHN